MHSSKDSPMRPLRDFLDFLLPPWWPILLGAPRIDDFDPARGEVGTEVIIRGRNLGGAEISFGTTPARVVSSARNEVTVVVPRIHGRQWIKAENFFGFDVAAGPFDVVEPSFVGPDGFTFRGDKIYHGASILSSIVPSALNQEYLVLMVLPSDLSLPTGTTEADLQADLSAKLAGASNSANSFWVEASYGKTSFTFDIHPNVLDLPDEMEEYYRRSRPKRMDASGATYPVTWAGGETLELEGDDGFMVTVTFPAGSQSLTDVIQEIRDAIEDAFTGGGDPPIKALNYAGQLRLETEREADDAVLEVTGGTAVATLGLDEPNVTVTPGASKVDNDYKLIVDALEKRVEGMSDDDARTYLSGYSGVIVAVVGSTSLLRASASTWEFEVRGENYEFSWVDITTSYTWQVYAHEIGHNLGFPDLYDEPGHPELVGTEPGSWDIMDCSSCDAHPTAWIKHYKTLNPDDIDETWMPPSEIAPMDPPPGTSTRTVEVLLAPTETPLPPVNPFAASHPGIPLRHAIQLRLEGEEGDRSLYVENRQRGPYSDPNFGDASYSSGIPSRGVIVTDTVNTMDGLPIFRSWVVMATPYFDPLDILNEEQTVFIFTTANTIRVKVTEVIGSNPTVYKVRITWGQGSYFDYRIRDWNPPPWESPDIWVDTRVDNDWDEYTHSDPVANPNVAGNPELNGDRSRVGWESRVYARVWNDGDIPKNGVRVRFQVVVPAGIGPTPGFNIGEDTIDLPAGGSALARVNWTPRDANEGHVCVRAMVVPDPDELNANNNMAQENITDWYLEGSSPYEPVNFPFQVANPLPRRAIVRMRARGLQPGWFMDVEPVQFWLEPGELIEGTAVIRADNTVPFEDLLLREQQRPPVITLEALAHQGDTWVPFGGISGTAHPVRKARIDVGIEPLGGSAVMVTGRASTSDGPIPGANVSLRVLKADRETEVDVYHTRTETNGSFTKVIQGPGQTHYLEVVLSPTAGTGPSDTDLIEFVFEP